MLEPCKLRWVRYNDYYTGQELLGACLASFELESANASTSCNGGLSGLGEVGDSRVPRLIGVGCVDVNLVVDPSTLESIAGYRRYEDFRAKVQDDMEACPRKSLTVDQMETLRAEAGGAFARCYPAPPPSTSPSPPPSPSSSPPPLSPPPSTPPSEPALSPSPSPSFPPPSEPLAADAAAVEAGSIAGPIAGVVIVGLLAVLAYKFRDQIKAKVAEVAGDGGPKLYGNASKPSVAMGSMPAQQPASGPNVTPIDTTGDGQIDSIMIDTTGDGRPDTVLPTVQKPAPVPVHAATIVDPPAVQPSEDTPEEVTSTVELVHTPLGLGLSIDGRNKVTEIDDDSQAGRSGLIELHDRLVSINGQPLSSSSRLEELLAAVAVGGKLSFEIARQVNVKARKLC